MARRAGGLMPVRILRFRTVKNLLDEQLHVKRKLHNFTYLYPHSEFSLFQLTKQSNKLHNNRVPTLSLHVKMERL